MAYHPFVNETVHLIAWISTGQRAQNKLNYRLTRQGADPTIDAMSTTRVFSVQIGVQNPEEKREKKRLSACPFIYIYIYIIGVLALYVIDKWENF